MVLYACTQCGNRILFWTKKVSRIKSEDFMKEKRNPCHEEKSEFGGYITYYKSETSPAIKCQKQ